MPKSPTPDPTIRSPKPDIRPAEAKDSDAGKLRLIVKSFKRSAWTGTVNDQPASYHRVVDQHGAEWRVWNDATQATVAALEWSLSSGQPVAVTIGRSDVPDEGDDILTAKMIYEVGVAW